MSRNLFKKGLITAMEEGDIEGLGEAVRTDEVEVQAADDLAEVADQVEEVTEEQTAIESLAFAIEESIDNVEEAEEVVETVAEVAGTDPEGEAGGEAEGLTEGEAQLAEEAFRLAFKKLGGAPNMPSMESFRSSNSRVSATKFALEGFMDTVRSVWQRILEAIRNLWGKVKAFFKKITDANKSLEKSAKSMKERVKKVTKTPSKNDDGEEFENASLVEEFPVSSGKLNGGHVKTLIKDIVASSVSTISNMRAYEDALNNLPNTVAEDSTSKDIIGYTERIVSSAVTSITGVATTVKADDREVEVEGAIVYIGRRSPRATAKIQFEVTPKNATGNNIESIDKSIELSYEFGDAVGNFTSETKVERGTSSELTSICDEVSTMSKENAKLAVLVDRIEAKTAKALSAFSKDADSRVKGPDEKTVKDLRAAYSLFQSAVSRESAVIASFLSAVGSLNVKAGRQALRYVNASLSHW